MLKENIRMLRKMIKVEYLKKKRSGIFVLSILIGVFIPAVNFVIQISGIEGDPDAQVRGIPVNYYWEGITKTVPSFAGFFLSLLIIITASKIAQIDHKNRGWNLMETQPVSKFAIFFSKFILLLTANLIAIVSFFVFSILFEWIFTFFHPPGPDKLMAIPFLKMIQLALRIFLAALAVTALQFTLSVIIKKFIWPILIGFIGLMVPTFAFFLNINFNGYPYELTSLTASHPNGSELGYPVTYTEVVSVFYAVIFLFIGYNWYRFKRFKDAFLTPAKRPVVLLAVLSVLGSLLYLTLKPKHQKPYTKTVLAGKVESETPINAVYLFDGIINDTLAKIPVTDGIFHQVIDKELLPDYYRFQIGQFTSKNLFLSTNDSLYITYKRFGNDDRTEISGTRLAEQLQKPMTLGNIDYFSYLLKGNKRIDKPKFYMKEIYKSWQAGLKTLNTIRTVDNLEPRADYLKRMRKNETLKYIRYWNEFKKKHDALFPGQEYELTENIKELENSLSYTDENMLTTDGYFELVSDALIKDDDRELPENTKRLQAISGLQKGSFRDKVLFKQLKKSLEDAENSAARDSLIKTYIGLIGRKSYRDLLLRKYVIFNRLGKGMPASDFLAYDAKGCEYRLSDFAGNFLAVDVWASWCGPCLYEAPYFKDLALKFKKEPVKFVSVSIDRIEENWIVAINDKKGPVKQLRARNPEAFAGKFNIQGIPRFMLIGPDGKLIDVDYSRPSDDSFSERLENYLKENKE